MLIFSLINICHSWAVLPSIEFSHSVISNSLWPRELQHARLPCPSPIPGACSNSCPSLIPSNHLIHIVPFSSCLQASPASWSFQMSQFFTSGCQSIGVSASTSAFNEYSGLISFRMDWLDLLAVQGTFKNILQHHSSKASVLWCSAFFRVQLSQPMHDYWKNHSLD